jgi:putative ATPase
LSQSLILWDPPGVAKTTIAHLIARASKLRCVPFSSVLSGIKEIRVVMAKSAEERRPKAQRTLLLMSGVLGDYRREQ